MVNALVARQRRRLLELSQAEVARRIGVDRRTVIAWEAGEMQPSLENAVAWAKAIDLDLADLVTEAAATEAAS